MHSIELFIVNILMNNLQEEVVNKVSWVASKLGMVSNEEDEYD